MTGPGGRASTVVIGVGNPMRRDDGVGAAVIRALGADRQGPRSDVELLALDGEPARLIEAWRGRSRAIVIDAARSDRPAGQVRRVDLAADRALRPAAGNSSHGAGVAEAVALGRALGVMPDELVLVAVEAGDLSYGDGLTPAVAEVVPAVVACVDEALA